MAKTLKLTIQQWDKLVTKLIEDYGKATVLISWRLKRELGFTPRTYRWWEPDQCRYYNDMRLDFYDDALQTMFLLKYGEYFDSEEYKDSLPLSSRAF